jgi:hypothetical protein
MMDPVPKSVDGDGSPLSPGYIYNAVNSKKKNTGLKDFN